MGAYERMPVRGQMPTPGGSRDHRHNVAVLRPKGASKDAWPVYRKRYLIPFGEAMPLGLPDSMLPQKFRMVAGKGALEPLRWNTHRIVPFLCYEGILPGHVRETVGDEAPQLLVSLTNDSWFGDTWEPHQHLNFTRFRAIEHACSMVRATNTGISAFVTPSGRVVDTLGVGKEGVLVADVPLAKGERTLYARWGHYLPWLLGLFAALAWVRAFTVGPAPTVPPADEE